MDVYSKESLGGGDFCLSIGFEVVLCKEGKRPLSLLGFKQFSFFISLWNITIKNIRMVTLQIS